MKKIIQFFNPKGEQSYFDQLKTNALIVISLVGFFLILFMLFSTLLNPDKNAVSTLIEAPFFIIFLLLNLILIKYTNISLAGNIFSVALVLILAVSINMLARNISPIYEYTQGLYVILGMYIIGVLFVSKRFILVLNTLIIIETSTRLYLLGIKYFPEDEDIFTAGYVNYLITIVIFFIIVYTTMQFVQKAINHANDKAEESDNKNKILKNIIEAIKNSSSQIYNASGQLKLISEQVSQNATEQAATTDEVSASMEQILSMVEANTRNAQLTGDSSVKSAQEIESSNEIFIQTINSISEISQRISIILEIANKTDILSINAAIEAARASNTGKGFAVVASEIRKLADKTKLASEEITRLSLNGQNISKQAGDKLSKLVPQIINNSELVQKIVLSNAEQLSGINAINTSMLQLSDITNQNTASAEEMSRSAEELSVQAEQLKKLVANIHY